MQSFNWGAVEFLGAAAIRPTHASALADNDGPLADDDGPLADDDGPLADDDGPLADDDGPLAEGKDTDKDTDKEGFSG